MNQLQQTTQPPQTIDSRDVAEMGQMRHSDLLVKLEGNKKTVGIIPTLNERNFPSAEYFIESTYKDAKGEERKCYLFTKKGCEFIANKFTGEKGILFTAKYVERFNEMESGQAIPTNLSPQLQLLINMELKQKEQDAKIEAIEQEQQNMKDIIAMNPNSWRKDSQTLIVRIAQKLGGNEYIKTVTKEVYELLNERMKVNLARRLTNKRQRMADEGVCVSKRKNLNYKDVIADDPKLIEGYVAIIKEMCVKYGVEALGA